ncbi:MAG: hypothetical protein ACKV19_13845 [Verrucomicrobiales bacterium]
MAVVAAGWWWLSQPAEGPTPARAGTAPSTTPPAPGTDRGSAIPDLLPGQSSRSPEPANPTNDPRPSSATDAAPRDPINPVPAAAAAGVEFPDTIDLNPVTSGGTEAARERDALMSQAFTKKAWPGYAALLHRSLVAATVKRTSAPPRADEVASLLKQPVFGHVLVRQAVLSEISDLSARPWLEALANRAFAEKLLSDPELGEALLTSVTPADQLEHVLATWADLWTEHEAARTSHTALALACSLVFEKPVSLTWNDQPLTVTAEGRFQWFLQQDRAGRLTGRITRMSATDLAWVVCAPVPESELEWALKKVKLRQDSWGDAYGMVKYDMTKAVQGTNSYDAYTFEEILEKGGICGDQSYFAANTARAHGIPAAVITGDGARGPHAWIRWMDRDSAWPMQGRFDGYALGNTRHAQSGQGLSEEWFVQRSERKATATESVRNAYHRLWLGRVLDIAGDTRRAGPLYDLAAAANRELPVAAEAQLRHWIAYRADAPVEEWRDLVAQLKKNFRENSNLMAQVQRAENEIIFPRQDGKSVVADLRRDIRQMEKEAARDGVTPKDEDLARSYARQADVLRQAGDIDAVRSLYRRALDDRANAATFKLLARDYFKAVADHPEAQLRACRDLESAWNRHVDTGGDYFDIGSQNSALAVIIECYRAAGENARADRLQKELDRRQGRAERKAL